MHELCYATSDKPEGPYEYGGVIVSNNDIGIDSYKNAELSMNYGANNHGGIEKIGDDWYNVDVCWDDVRLFTHTYFLRTDKAFSSNHTVKMPISCPKATKRYPVDQYGNEAA